MSLHERRNESLAVGFQGIAQSNSGLIMSFKEYAMKKWTVFFLFLILTSIEGSAAWAEIQIGILARRGADVAEREWSALGTYLSGQMGDNVIFRPLKFTEVMDFCSNNRQQFLFANSWFYVRAKVLYGAKALVTVKNQGSGVFFGGVILTRNGGSVKTIEDIRGKTLMCPKFSSAGGWIFQKGVMVKAGLVPEKECTKLLEGQTHDAVVEAVINGSVDVGTVRTNIIENMRKEGKIGAGDLVIIHPTPHENFPEFCSTPLYPTWPIAALGKTEPSVAEKLKQALLGIPTNHQALGPCKVERFVEAQDYGPLEDLLRFLKVTPFRGTTDRPEQ